MTKQKPKTTKALREVAKTMKASKARAAEVGTVDFCCVELTLLPAQEHPCRMLWYLSYTRTPRPADTLPRARNDPRFPHWLQPPAGFSAQWSKKKKYKLFLRQVVNLFITSVLPRHGQDLACKAEHVLAALRGGCSCQSSSPNTLCTARFHQNKANTNARLGLSNDVLLWVNIGLSTAVLSGFWIL